MSAFKFFAWTYLIIQFSEGFDGNCDLLYPVEIPYPCSPQTCVSCPLGYGVAQFCNRTSPTVCHPCVKGHTYSNLDNPYATCSPVSLCSENMVIARHATTKHDVTCKCADGYTGNFMGFCVKYFLPTPTVHHQTVNGTSNKDGTVTRGRPTVASPVVDHGVKSPSTTTVYLNTDRTNTSKGITSFSSNGQLTETVTTKGASAPTVQDIKPVSKSSIDQQTLIIVVSVCATVVVVTWGVVILTICYRKHKRRTLEVEDNQMLPLMASESSESVDGHHTGVHTAIGDEDTQSFILSCPLQKWYLVPVWKAYYWTFPDSKLSTSDDIQQKRSKLIFSRLSPHHAGQYSYEAGSKKSSVHLLVKRDLKPVLNVEGLGTVELSFIVWGSEEPCDYQWFKNGAPMSHRPQEYRGETSSTLKIINTSKSMRGQYHCLATCKLTRIRSHTTTLNIIGNRLSKRGNDLSHSASASENENDTKDQGKTVAIAMVHDHVDRADGVEEAELMNGVGTKSETELSRQVVAQASSDETLIKAKFQYLHNLSEGMIHQLGVTIEKTLKSLNQIAVAVHIDSDSLGTVSRTHHPGVVLLEELRDANPYYPLAQLCRVFSECGRLDCVSKLQSLITRAGGRLPLPAGVTAVNDESSDVCISMDDGE